MKIEKYVNDDGEYRCFAVDNLDVSRNGLVRMIAQLEGVKITKFPKFRDDALFCEFELNDNKFIIEEPYGDSSTYDVIAPEPNLKEMETLFEHVQNTTPIKGGDIGHKAFFLSTRILFPTILFYFLYSVWLKFL